MFKKVLIVAVCLLILFSLFTVSAMPHKPKMERYIWNNVTVVGGGYVPGIIFNTKQKDLIYARTDIGGAYRWNPCTKSWIPLLDWVGPDDWSLSGVASLATDPVEPNRLYIAAGCYTNDWTSINAAILRSTNYGKSFKRTVLPFKLGGNMPGRSMGERLAIDPNKNSIVYLGAPSGNGLWRSLDYGATWSKVASFPNPGTYVMDPNSDYTKDIIGVVWVTFDPKTGSRGKATNTIYVGVADKGLSIYRSNDAGATWEAVPGQPTGFLPHHGILGSNGLLYISYSDTCGPYDGGKGDVWKFDTASGSWTLISPIPSTSGDDYFGYGGLAVDAQNPNTIMVASLNSWWPDAIIFRSNDAGATWKRIWEWGGWPNRILHYAHDISAAPWLDWSTPKDPPEIAPKLGWMMGDLDIDPFNSDRMMYGTGATIYGTEDLTAWDTNGLFHISVMAQGIEETAVLDLISPPEGVHLISALGDIGGFPHENFAKVPVKMMTNPIIGSTTSMDFAELRPSVIVRVGNQDGKGIIGFSQDGGANWVPAATLPANTTEGGTVALAADARAVVWSPRGAAVHYSIDNGATWTASEGIPAGARVSSDRVNPKKFYGFASGQFFVSTDGGATFTASAATGLPTILARFKAVPGREGDIWLGGGDEKETIRGMWQSTNSGASFTKLENVTAAECVGFGKAAPKETYPAIYTSATIGGIRGIFRSDNAGASWVRINDDDHQYAWTGAAITGDPRIYGRVYVATNGRGIIYGDTKKK
jgi:xyloglucan-specific exo-beta-1,4-glucanase